MDKDQIKEKLRSLGEKTLTFSKAMSEKISSKLSPKARSNLQQLGHTLTGSSEHLIRSAKEKGIGFYGRLATVVICAHFVSDVTSLYLEDWIPEGPVRSSNIRYGKKASSEETIDQFASIWGRNLFNSRGLIPDDDGNLPIRTGDEPAVKTSLPIQLIGTVILEEENRSLGTIQDKTDNEIYPVQIGDEIPGRIRVLKVEPYKVTFYNLKSRRKEFIDLPEDQQISRPVTTSSRPTENKIEKVSSNRFQISREEIESNLSNLNKILTQARAVPHFEHGAPAGYKIMQIVPGSIYQKLGLKNGDVITGLNGDPVSDPGKAFQMLEELKTANHMELSIKRNGSEQVLTYDIQ